MSIFERSKKQLKEISSDLSKLKNLSDIDEINIIVDKMNKLLKITNSKNISKYDNNKTNVDDESLLEENLIFSEETLKELLPKLEIKDFSNEQLELFGLKKVVLEKIEYYEMNYKAFLFSYYLNNYNNHNMITEKAEFAFNFYSKKKEKIYFSDLLSMLRMYNRLNCLSFDEDSLITIANALFDELCHKETSQNISDTKNQRNDEKYISKINFINFLEKNKNLSLTFNLLTKDNARLSIIESCISSENNDNICEKIKTNLEINYSHYFWVLCYIAANVYLATEMFLNSYKIYISIGFAKMFRGIILVNSGLVLLFQSKYITTFLANTFVKYIIPFENFPYYHKFTSFVFIFGSIFHSLAHVIGTVPFILNSNLDELNKALFTPFKTLPTLVELLFIYCFGWTGILLLMIMITVLITSLECNRKKRFELFYYIHMLNFLIYPLGYIHGLYHLVGPQLWHVMAGGPLAILILEGIYRFYLYIYSYDLIDVRCLSSGVVQIMVKNDGFNLKPGQFVSICFPHISKVEFHPFTISGIFQHENISFFTLHISPVGDWTKKVQDLSKSKYQEKLDKLSKNLEKLTEKENLNEKENKFKITDKLFNLLNNEKNKITDKGCVNQQIEDDVISYNSNNTNESIKSRESRMNANKIILNTNFTSIFLSNSLINIEFPKIKVLGPFGAPTQKYKDFKRLVFIAAGIGATPFASILNQIDKEKESYIKIEFYWMQRQANQFVWLFEMLKQIMKTEKNIEFNIYYTCPYQKNDFRAFFLWHGLELCKRNLLSCNKNTSLDVKNSVDSLSNFCKNIYWSRPEWKDVFKKIKLSILEEVNNQIIKSIEVGVFVCGGSELCKEISNCCKTTTCSDIKFYFYKENF